MAASLPPESDSDRASWRALLAIAVDAAGSQGLLADVLRCDRSAITRYLDGSRSLGWAILRAALLRTARRYPAAVPAMVSALAAELLDARGRWVPEGVAVGDVETEEDDIPIAFGKWKQARRSGDVVAMRLAMADLQKQTDELAASFAAEAK